MMESQLAHFTSKDLMFRSALFRCRGEMDGALGQLRATTDPIGHDRTRRLLIRYGVEFGTNVSQLEPFVNNRP